MELVGGVEERRRQAGFVATAVADIEGCYDVRRWLRLHDAPSALPGLCVALRQPRHPWAWSSDHASSPVPRLRVCLEQAAQACAGAVPASMPPAASLHCRSCL